MAKRPTYYFSISIPEGMTTKAETQKANRIWNLMKNEAPYNRKDKVQILLHLTCICATLLERATDYMEEVNKEANGYIQHFDPS